MLLELVLVLHLIIFHPARESLLGSVHGLATILGKRVNGVGAECQCSSILLWTFYVLCEVAYAVATASEAKWESLLFCIIPCFTQIGIRSGHGNDPEERGRNGAPYKSELSLDEQ